MGELDMHEIVRQLREVHGIGDAYVEHTGGGCATIYAGPRYPDPEQPGDTLHPAVAGPGAFRGQTKALAHSEEFSVGPDDQCESWPLSLPYDADEAYAARLIAVQARLADPKRPPTPEELAAAGIITCEGTALTGARENLFGGMFGTCTTCGYLYAAADKDGSAVPHLPTRLAG